MADCHVEFNLNQSVPLFKVSTFKCSQDLVSDDSLMIRVASPFCHIHLLAQKPQKWQSLDPPRTISDHIRKRRLQLGWGAIQLAHTLHVSTETIYNWEKGRTYPEIRFMPRIVEFLGYTPPLFNRETIGKKIVAYRQVRGVTQKELAHILKVDPATLGRWERNESLPRGKFKLRLEPFFREILSGGGRTER